MTAERPGNAIPGRNTTSVGFLTDRRLRLFFVLLLVASTAVRVIVSVFPKTAMTYNDELFYLEIAQNLWLKGSVTVYSAPIRFTKILYSVLIAPFCAVTDGVLRTQLISGFNALLLSSALIPGWLLARRMLKNNLHTAFSMLFLALSPNLLLSLTFMAENLYCPLLMWGLYALYRFLTAKRPRPVYALLLGALAYLLYFTKESGAAFLLGLAVMFVAVRSFASLGLSLLGFVLPWLAVKLLVFRDVGYTYAAQASFSGLSTASQLMFLLYGCLITALFFLVSSLWFPVAVPLLRRRELPQRERSLLVFSAGYTAALIVGIAYAVLLNDGDLTAFPRIHLRYLIGGAWPFLLLFLQGFETEDRSFSGKPFRIWTLLFSAAILLFLFIPHRGSLVDYPVLHFFEILRAGTPLLTWLCKGFAILLILAVFFFLYRGKRKAGLSVLMSVFLVFEVVSGVQFYRTAVREEKIRDPELLSEVRQLDQIMDHLGPNVLVATPSNHNLSLKLLNTVSNDDYAVAETDALLRLFQEQEHSAFDPFVLPPQSVPVPYVKFAVTAGYDLPSLDYIVTVGEWRLIDPEMNEEITPEGMKSFRVYQSKDPSRLNLLNPMIYRPGEQILFYGDRPLFRSFAPAGFSGTETGWTWSAGNEASLTLRPLAGNRSGLTATWTWKMTNGEQPCEIYANDLPVASETLSEQEKSMNLWIPAECYADTGLLTLRFVFPEAREPGNGDHRQLAVAFESLILE